MKKIIILFISLLVLNGLQAQTKTIVNDEACYVHLVEKGNTLYGISKQYAVGIPDLFRVNPEARLGMSIGQEVYIPISSINRKEARRSPDLEGSILFHTVKRGETLYSLSKHYKVGMNEILEANPSLTEGNLSKGQRVRIPTSLVDLSPEVITPAVQDSLISHEILAGETIYGITKLYSISEDSLREVNGGLPEGLKAGERLRIPIYREGFTPSQPLNGSAVDSASVYSSSPMREIMVAYLLPFSLNGTDSTYRIPSQSDIMRMTDIAFEFYRGARFALHDLKERGLTAKAIVLDVGSDKEDVEKAIHTLKSEQVDLIIGPMHRGAFKKISEDNRMKGKHFVSPVSKNLDVNSYKNSISKVSGSSEAMMEHLSSYLRAEHSADNLIFISGSKRSLFTTLESEWMVSDSLGERTFKDKAFKPLAWDRYFEDSLEELLSAERPNVIVFPSFERSVITEFMSKMALTRFKNYEITLVGLEEWLDFDNLDAELLAELSLTVCASQYLDTSSQNYLDFMKRYYKDFNTIPSRNGFAFQAYDITNFYLSGLMKHGEYFINHQSDWRSEGLQLGFQMSPSGADCFENQYSIIIQNEGQHFKVMDKRR